MTRILLTVIIIFTAILHCTAQIDTTSIDRIVQESVSDNLFEGTVLVAEKGNVIYHKSFGYRDLDKRIPVTPDAQFSIASITKLFTAILILQLAEEGKFKLSDNLKLLLPKYRIPKSRKITVHHLLLHITGLPNEDDLIYSQSKSPKEFVAETLSNKRSRFGTFNYANIDYVLLGLIIEKFTNKPWAVAVQERILDKAKMQASGFLEKDNYPNDFVYSFSFDEKKTRQIDPPFFIENFYAAGCMYSTATDLLKLDQAMYSDLLLTTERKEQMYTSYPAYNYSGYSVWTYNYPFAESKPKVMERRGGIFGANSVLIRMMDTNKTIIILSNNNQFNPDSFGDTKGLKEALMIDINKTSR